MRPWWIAGAAALGFLAGVYLRGALEEPAEWDPPRYPLPDNSDPPDIANMPGAHQ